MNKFCTIVDTNYLPQALSMLDSLVAHHPESEFYLLISDISGESTFKLDSIRILTLEDLKFDVTQLDLLLKLYDTVEFATCLKPLLIGCLLTDKDDIVTYLDPDIIVFSRLDRGLEIAMKNGIALTPHRLTPSQVQLRDFNEMKFLKYGIFNLGYISVSEKSRPMLAWWSERLMWFCTIFPDDSAFTDQKWIDFVPALFDFGVIRDRGYNLATWNIDERELFVIDGKFHTIDGPLVFIHFSQMSGGLARGQRTKVWDQVLADVPDSNLTLKIITDITLSYSTTLLRQKIEIQKLLSDQPKVERKIPLSTLQRRTLRNRSLEFWRNTHLYSSRVSFFTRVTARTLKYLERSQVWVGIRLGLQSDVRRLKKKLLHK
jgi:lipopolysaccharide biosynthesis glycosyltransferase